MVAVACTLTFTTPGVGVPDSVTGCASPIGAVPDWRPALIELRAWALEDPSDSTVIMRKPARAMGERDTMIFERTSGPWTACVEMVRWNGLRPCRRVCLALGNWPVGVTPPALVPPSAFNPRITLQVMAPFVAPDGWKLFDISGRAHRVATRAGYYWLHRKGQRSQRVLVGRETKTQMEESR